MAVLDQGSFCGFRGQNPGIGRAQQQARAMAEQTSSFVPLGVDAGTWMGFEQRIRSRRFAALVEQFEQAVLVEDRDAAQAALDEAGELRPDAPEVRAAAARLAVLQSGPQPVAEAHAWSRVIGAVSLLLIGVS